MTEPQCYHCDVNSRLEKMHSTCVSNQMRSDICVSKTWASCHASLNSMLKNVVNAVHGPKPLRSFTNGDNGRAGSSALAIFSKLAW